MYNESANTFRPSMISFYALPSEDKTKVTKAAFSHEKVI